MRTLFSCFLIASAVLAQETVAPTAGEKVGPVRGENTGDYNVVQSWEFGYRYAAVAGNTGEYRSDVNYHDGFRLLAGSLTVNSKDGRGKWFDELILTTQGLGNDPYEAATLRVQKNRWYQYDLLWRQNDYFNPGLTVANGAHLEDTTYAWQDHELTLFPRKWHRVRMGYSRTTQNGPALTTEQEFNGQGTVYPIFRNVKDQYNEFRFGGDTTLKGFRLTTQHRWQFFKEDTADNQAVAVQGTAPQVLTSFYRSQPYRGKTSGFLVNLYFERPWIAVNGRFTYGNTKGNFVQNETARGADRFGASQNQQVIVLGNGDRPVLTADLNETLFPQGRFSVINSTSVNNTRMDGNNLFEQFSNANFTFSTLNFQLLNIRLITNATDLRYRFSKKLNGFVGYRFAQRRIQSVEDTTVPGQPYSGIAAQQSNHTESGVAGFNWLPFRGLRAHLEAEIGRNDNPFTPVSLRNYQALRGKVQYRAKSWSLGAGYQENYNNNSIQITAYSSHARTYSADASWAAKSWVSVDASYNKLHLDTVGGIDYFAGSPFAQEVSGTWSTYISNIHAANLGLRFAVTKRADLYAGYNITKDAGDGRTSLQNASTVSGVFYNAQTFPLTYQSPLFRLSVRLTEKLRFNLGYQYYGYNEQFGLFSTYGNFHASTGYTSLLWSF